MVVVGKMSAKHQITVPIEVRETLGIDGGDRLIFRIEDGKVFVEALKDVESSKIFGMLNTDTGVNEPAVFTVTEPTNTNNETQIGEESR